jgi:hypothetical protein
MRDRRLDGAGELEEIDRLGLRRLAVLAQPADLRRIQLEALHQRTVDHRLLGGVVVAVGPRRHHQHGGDRQPRILGRQVVVPGGQQKSA